MLSKERKEELINEIEYAVNKYLDKKCILEELEYDLFRNQEEMEFLRELEGDFTVYRDEE